MKLTAQENITIKEVYNPLILESDAGERLSIVMRDSGFEVTYGIDESSPNMVSFVDGKIDLVSNTQTSEQLLKAFGYSRLLADARKWQHKELQVILVRGGDTLSIIASRIDAAITYHAVNKMLDILDDAGSAFLDIIDKRLYVINEEDKKSKKYGRNRKPSKSKDF